MTPHALFRRLALAEATTWALLLAGMFLKYVTRTTEVGVQVFGMVHGVVFLGYCVVAVFVAVNQRWRTGTTLLALAAAVPPFATVWFERRMSRQGGLDGGWRLRPGGEVPSSRPEWLQAAMLRRPGRAVLVGLVVVAALTGLALLAGPPVPPGA